ncbi:ATP-binding protein [Notoacmeibacter ruber]|uniref:YhaN AAA domain-containing protein n=1 Tax=Notoacmeibacter ruber TaxID=2670375 RepID=A0A3L7J985_9HYPH|nr:YhaN family protein [Notoacmeibacter ruber]RLQ87243.1 hypothetical protein D8780_02475 [Notoacmeibacter ruber]
MRFLHLDLMAYGAFADRRLTFRQDAGLHVVYGPNEAGKSTMLQAIGDLLFGFPARKQMDFRHDAASLRVGASIRAADGREFAFTRRRGNKATLRDPGSDDVLPDESLAAFLGGMDRQRFEREFGLTAEALRQGGETLAGLSGDLGASLLAASSGLGGLRKLREAIEAEADSIFSKRKSKDRIFWIASEERDEARAEERDVEIALSAQEWRDTEKAIQETAGLQEEANAELAAAEIALASAERRLALRPALRHLDQARERLSQFASLETFTDDLPERLESTLAERESAEEVLRDLSERHRVAEARREGLEARPDLAEAADAVRLVAEDLGRYRKDVADVPKVQAQLRERREAIGRQLSEMGIAADKATVTRITVAQRADLRQEALHLQDAERERGRLEKEAEALQRRLDSETSSDEITALPETRQLERAVAALRPVFDDAVAAEQESRRAQDDLEASRQAALALDPSVADLDRCVDRPVPLQREWSVLLNEWRGHHQERENRGNRLAETRKRIAAIKQRIGEAERTEALVDPLLLSQSRQSRDRKLGDLREGTSSDWDGLHTAIVETDRIADRLLAEAESGAGLRRDRAEQAREEKALEDDESAIEELDRQLANWQARWQALFASITEKPPLPERTESWMARFVDLRDDASDARRRLKAATRALATAQDQVPALRELAGVLGLGQLGGLGVLHLWAAILERLAEVAAERQSRAATDALRHEHERMLRDHRQQIEQFDATIALSRARLDQDLGDLGLPTGHGADAVLTLLESLASMSSMQEEAARLQTRVEGLEADVERYRSRVMDLLSRLAPDLCEEAPDAAVTILWQRCQKAVTTAERLSEAEEELTTVEDELAFARGRTEETRQNADLILSTLPETLDATTFIERLRERRAARRSCQDQERQFTEIAQDLTESEVREAVQSEGEEAAHRAILELRDAKDAAQDKKQRLAQELGRLGQQLEGLRRRKGSELAAFRRQGAEERMEIAAHEWGRLKAASILLDAAMDRYAKSVPNTTLDGAANLFELLTDGAFSGLAEDLDAEGRPILLVTRNDGTRLPVNGTLSEGTRDQLYLALRLGWLKERAAQADLPPFVGDDLFASFDDQRTEAGLKALSSVSPSLQPILFTHHRAVVETARKALGDRLDLIEL